MLTNRLEINTWVDIPHEPDCRMNILSSGDIKLIHQSHVRPEYRLVSRISQTEYDFLGLLCDLTQKNEGDYVSTEQLAMANYGFADQDEHRCIYNNICRLRKKIQCLTSVMIQSEPDKGYKIVKKSS